MAHRNGALLTNGLNYDRLGTPGNKLIARRTAPGEGLFHIMWKGTEMSQDDSAGTQGGQVAELLPAFRQMADELRQIAALDVGAGFEIAARVINEIAQAETIDDVFAANEGGPQSVEDLLGQPMGVYGVRFWKSAEKFAEGTLGVYVVADYVDASYETQMFATGAPNVVASLRRFEMLNAYAEGKENPLWLTIKGRETGRGTLYTVAKAEQPPF